MGALIAQLRKEKHLTQKELAQQLNITDKAISKWERGLSFPDIALLTPLSTLLGITTAELLSGKRSPDVREEKVKKITEHALEYAGQVSQMKTQNLKRLISDIFSLYCLIAIVVCIITDLALSGGLTWSLYPLYSILFAWLVAAPAMYGKRRPVRGSLIALSIFILPFLLALHALVDTNGLLFSLGAGVTLLALCFLWLIYWLFFLIKSSVWHYAAAATLASLPFIFLINLVISRTLATPLFEVLDVLDYGVPLIAAAVLYLTGQRRSSRLLERAVNSKPQA